MRSYTDISMIKYSPRKWLPHTGRVERRRRVLLSIAAGCALCIIMLTSYNAAIVSSSHSIKSIFSSLFPNSTVDHPVHEYVQCCDEDGINFSSSGSATCNCEDHHVSFARFAYLIAGVRGEEDRVWRVLRAVYHPLNQYVIHLEASDEHISAFAVRLTMDPVYSNVGNVIMMMKADRITYSGPTMVANTLHAAAILLRQSKKWNWFVNLSPSDYPLVSQDDLIYTFTSIQRNLSFIDNTKELGGKMEGRGQRVIIDPGLYMKNKSKAIIMTPERRPVPDAFTLYTGSAWLVLSRAFMEFCISGWDNLPRELLMYHANIVITTEFYFQTVICNSEEFMPTVVNHDMHFILWSYPHPGQHPITLTMTHLNRMIASNAPFARKFGANDPVLDVIDSQYLGRNHSNGFTYGGWCSGFPPCSQVGNITHLVPGPGAKRLQSLMDRVLTSYENKCNSTHPFL